MLGMMIVMAFPLLGIALFFLLPWQTALPLYLGGLVLSLLLHRAMARSMKLPIRMGRGSLVGQEAEVLSWDHAEGRVRCRGESWHARARDPQGFDPGQRVEVVELAGATLEVVPLAHDAGKER
jgi:membrane protein implicated in regulation of membrane protease activity